MNPDITTDSEKGRYRRDLLSIYSAALQEVEGARAVTQYLKSAGNESCAVIAIGKAAAAMMRGAIEVLDTMLHAGLVVTRKGYADPGLVRHPAIAQIESSHPVPDESSLAAGRQLLDFIQGQPLNLPLLFLISGGASSLVEVLVAGVGVEELQRLNHWLLGSGLDIHSMNGLRRRLSRIKGGGLLRFLQGRRGKVLLISDVPGDDPGVIGSGLLYPPTQEQKLPDVPDWLSALPMESPLSGYTAWPHHLVASSRQAVQAAARRASALGYPVWTDYPLLEGDAAEQGRAFARMLCNAPPGVHIRGGETTVILPPQPGRGGRNQHLALAAARVIAGRDDVFILAAGTDGSDGVGGDAGALVDGKTWKRAQDEALNPALSLQQADSGTILEAMGALVSTGPTDTNVMDLLAGLRLSAKT